MKILFLISGDRVPSSRFRVLPYISHFRQAGHRVKVASSFPQKYDHFPWMGFRPSQLLKKLVRYWHLFLCKLGRYEIVFIDRELFDNDSWKLEAKFRKLAAVFVLDVDDAVFLRYPEKFDRLVEMCDLVIAGNSFLKEKIEPGNSNIVVIPTCVKLQDYPAKDSTAKYSEIPIVGWMGTTGNLNYLKVVAEPLKNLAKRCDFELRLIAPEADPLNEIDLVGVNVRFVTWKGETEVDELRKIDIGMMPLFEADEWNKYKCGLKLIQYMAIGIPGVASPVGVNADIVEHGVNSYLAANDEEWEEILFTLIQDKNLRQKVGTQARETVREKYSIEANYPLLEKSLQQELSRGVTTLN